LSDNSLREDAAGTAGEPSVDWLLSNGFRNRHVPYAVTSRLYDSVGEYTLKRSRQRRAINEAGRFLALAGCVILVVLSVARLPGGGGQTPSSPPPSVQAPSDLFMQGPDTQTLLMQSGLHPAPPASLIARFRHSEEATRPGARTDGNNVQFLMSQPSES